MTSMTRQIANEIQSIQTSSLSDSEYKDHEQMRQEIQKHVDEFLAAGGQIQKVEPSDYIKKPSYNLQITSGAPKKDRTLIDIKARSLLKKKERNKEIARLWDEGLTMAEIAKKFDMYAQNVNYILKKMELK